MNTNTRSDGDGRAFPTVAVRISQPGPQKGLSIDVEDDNTERDVCRLVN